MNCLGIEWHKRREHMQMNCPTHGEIEARVDASYNAWCPECLEEKLREFLLNEGPRPTIEHTGPIKPFSMGCSVVVESTPHGDGGQPFYDAFKTGSE